jgi:GNAT superfamily N-acetyltransferase
MTTTAGYEIERYACGALSAADDAALEMLSQEAFQSSPYKFIEMRWADPLCTYLIREAGIPISALTILIRDVFVGDQAARVGGIGSVMTALRCRGRGHAGRLISAAEADFRDEYGLNFGLLQCPDARITFYESLGWRQAGVAMWHVQPDNTRHRILENPMIRELTDQPWPAGQIDMNGLPW